MPAWVMLLPSSTKTNAKSKYPASPATHKCIAIISMPPHKAAPPLHTDISVPPGSSPPAFPITVQPLNCPQSCRGRLSVFASELCLISVAGFFNQLFRLVRPQKLFNRNLLLFQHLIVFKKRCSIFKMCGGNCAMSVKTLYSGSSS